ncbi:hypothetical protein MNBD_DELTA02-1212 [hydrothermal vent metagenome]|uniref:Uncharacterized protein n=1 Tax=hydrothermal vent metagenome TaxID=652676 RepID=A0A3B0VML0_9ZZZZ
MKMVMGTRTHMAAKSTMTTKAVAAADAAVTAAKGERVMAMGRTTVVKTRMPIGPIPSMPIRTKTAAVTAAKTREALIPAAKVSG